MGKRKCFFTVKLRDLLNQQQFSQYIAWTEAGDAFIVRDTEKFAHTVLPVIFKTNNYKSFLRQARKYVGFNASVYSNPDFHRDREYNPDKVKGFTHDSATRGSFKFLRSGDSSTASSLSLSMLDSGSNAHAVKTSIRKIAVKPSQLRSFAPPIASRVFSHGHHPYFSARPNLSQRADVTPASPISSTSDKDALKTTFDALKTTFEGTKPLNAGGRYFFPSFTTAKPLPLKDYINAKTLPDSMQGIPQSAYSTDVRSGLSANKVWPRRPAISLARPPSFIRQPGGIFSSLEEFSLQDTKSHKEFLESSSRRPVLSGAKGKASSEAAAAILPSPPKLDFADTRTLHGLESRMELVNFERVLKAEESFDNSSQIPIKLQSRFVKRDRVSISELLN
ncbi:MAG: hypothetical protein SGCHY_003057 [Lobulomycetales sp.]